MRRGARWTPARTRRTCSSPTPSTWSTPPVDYSLLIIRETEMAKAGIVYVATDMTYRGFVEVLPYLRGS